MANSQGEIENINQKTKSSNTKRDVSLKSSKDTTTNKKSLGAVVKRLDSIEERLNLERTKLHIKNKEKNNTKKFKLDATVSNPFSKSKKPTNNRSKKVISPLNTKKVNNENLQKNIINKPNTPPQKPLQAIHKEPILQSVPEQSANVAGMRPPRPSMPPRPAPGNIVTKNSQIPPRPKPPVQAGNVPTRPPFRTQPPKKPFDDDEIDLNNADEYVEEKHKKKKLSKKNKRGSEVDLGDNTDFSLEDNDAVRQEKSLNQKKERKKRKWLLLLLLLLLFLLVFFLVWGEDIFNPPTEFYFDPRGNVAVVESPIEDITIEDYKFMPGDDISFENDLSIYTPKRNADGHTNNMFSFRFKGYIEYEGTLFDVVESINLVTADNPLQDVNLSLYRGYYYYMGIILPGSSPLPIIRSVELAPIVGNELQGKTVHIVFKVEVVFPTDEQINENFGTYPPLWYEVVTQMGESLIEQGYY